MTTQSPIQEPPRRITLDELTALCDEMVSLSRAGVPLDRGLVQLAEDLPSRLSSQARNVGERLESGQSLADVVASDDSPFPAVYKSVVEAGLRSGKLTVALEGFARLARQMAELRRLVISALVYPLLLLFVMIAISMGLLGRFGTDVHAALLSLKGRGSESDWAAGLLENYAVWSQWFWVIPAALFVLGMAWFIVTQTGGMSDWINWVPGASRLLRNSRLQAFAEVMALLVRQQVPLGQALRLAGSATGDARLNTDAEQLADQIERGDTETSNSDRGARNSRGIPPFLRWSLLNSHRSGKLEASLDRASETYRRRTDDSAAWLRRTLPIIFSFSLGGIVSILYAATVFLPWYTMLRSLGAAMEAM